MASTERQLVKDLFARAISLPSGERAAFIEASGLPATVQVQVRELLEHHDTSTILPVSRGGRRQTSIHSPSPSVSSVRILARRWAPVVAVALGLIAALVLVEWARQRARTYELRSITAGITGMNDSMARALMAAFESRRAEVERIALRYHDVLIEALRHPGGQRQQAALRGAFAQVVTPGRYENFFLMDSGGRLCDSDMGFAPGQVASTTLMARLTRLNEGESISFFEGREDLFSGQPRTVPRTYASIVTLAPVRNATMAGALGLIQSQPDIHRWPSTWFGETGEVIIFLSDGLALNELRFAGVLQKAGIAPAVAGAEPRYLLRDPEVILGTRPAKGDPSTWPMTLAVRTALAADEKAAGDGSGVLTEPYRAYRGVPVFGAWKWLSRYQVGVVTEVDASVAFRSINALTPAIAALATIGVVSTGVLAAVALNWWPRRRKRHPGDLFGSYRLDEKIGEGGLGEVFLAHHEVLQRPAAIKVLRRDRMTLTTTDQFEREVKIAAQLRHPNTIEILDFGQLPDGNLYCAMEYLPGADLARWVRRHGPLTAARVRYVARQLCGSLLEAHQAGLLHRDLKPANVMLTSLGGQYDVAKLLDFGLAKPFSEPGFHTTNSTAIAGTPYYVAPERLAGRGSVDERSDIYSLGVLMFFLLTGRVPFDESVPWVEATLTARRLSLAEAGVCVPPSFSRLIDRCMERDPARRPASMAEVERALDDLEPALPWTQRDAERAWQSHAAAARA